MHANRVADRPDSRRGYANSPFYSCLPSDLAFGSEAGGDLALIQTFLLYHVNAN